MTRKTGKEKILEVARKKNVFRAGDLEMPPSHTHKYIERLRKEGLIEKVGYGLYSLSDREFTENTNLVEVSARIPSAVFCLLTASYTQKY